MKTLLITNIPNPYRIPLFNLLAEKLQQDGHSLEVLFAVKGYSRRKFTADLSECKFAYQFLGSKGFRFGGSEGLLFTYPGLIRKLLKMIPDRIIVSGFSMATMKLWYLSWFRSLAYVIWSGSVQQKGRFDSIVRRFIRKQLVRRASAFIAYGSHASAYLQDLGADSSRIYIGINTVDTEFFCAETEKFRRKNDDENVPVLTYIGYLTQRKNVSRLIDLAKALSEKLPFKLQIIGDGDQTEKLTDQVKRTGISDSVEFMGFKQKDELPAYFAQTDLFLFQTDFDIWGLVLNEAMAAGCCCLASRHAGATRDLIKEGETGFCVDFNEVEEVTKLILDLVSHPEFLGKVGKNAQKYIQQHVSLAHTVQGFMKAIGV